MLTSPLPLSVVNRRRNNIDSKVVFLFPSKCTFYMCSLNLMLAIFFFLGRGRVEHIKYIKKKIMWRNFPSPTESVAGKIFIRWNRKKRRKKYLLLNKRKIFWNKNIKNKIKIFFLFWWIFPRVTWKLSVRLTSPGTKSAMEIAEL